MRRVFLVLGGAALLAVAPYWFLRDDGRALDLWSLAVTVGAIAAVMIGISRNRPLERLPWYLVVGAIGCVTASELVSLVFGDATEATFPSVARALQFAAFPVLLVSSLAIFARRRTAAREWAAIVDTVIIALGAVSLGMVALVMPAIDDPSLTQVAKAAIGGFAVAGLALLAVTVRLLLTAGLREPAHVLIGLATLMQLFGGAAYLLAVLHGWNLTASPIVLAPLAATVLWGAAALQPGMGQLTQPNLRPEQWLTRGRLMLLAPAVTAVLGAISFEALVTERHDRITSLVMFTLLMGLIAARLLGLALGYERAVKQEAVLQSGSAALAVAQTHDEIRRAGVEAATDLAGGSRQAYVDVDLTTRPKLDIPDAAVVGSGEIVAALRGEIRYSGSLARVGAARTLIVPIVLRDRLEGVLRVTGVHPLAAHLQRSLDTLAGKIALALEGVELADDLLEQRSEARFRSLVQNSNDLIAVLEPDLTVRYATPSAATLFGYEPAELVGTRLDERLHPDELESTVARLRDDVRDEGSIRHEFRLRRSDGTWATLEAVMSDLLDDPAVGGLVLTAHDVTERFELEEQLTHQAFHDPLTDLPNRALLTDRVTHALARAARSGSDVAVLFLDVDDFKTINDSLGHEAGDEVLVEVAARLRGCMRGSDTAARLGGDEFAVVLEETRGVEGAAAFAERVLQALVPPIVIAGTEIVPRASIGITFGRIGQATGELLRNADVAMYQAKRAGGSRYELYDPQMHRAALTRLEMKADLERAFLADELELHYQPIVDLGTGAAVGFEALLRWTHPVRGPIPPGEFVPLAEETGLICDIGRWVLQRAAVQAREWQLTVPGCRQLSANVNVSARQILEPGFVEGVEAVLRDSELGAESLVLEITESTLMEDVKSVSARLAELRDIGARIAIDDFGTGFSSLSYLQKFPVDELKIDKEFVDDVVFDSRKARLVEGIVRLADSLNLRTIAEGIEEPEQRARLMKMGCMLGQGYLFARPVPAADMAALLSAAAVGAA